VHLLLAQRLLARGGRPGARVDAGCLLRKSTSAKEKETRNVILKTFCINILFDRSHRKGIIAISKCSRLAREL
jgi:hypothetical protein